MNSSLLKRQYWKILKMKIIKLIKLLKRQKKDFLIIRNRNKIKKNDSW
jgi:hypothetical protein